ncbi:MAG: DMT family transporter, partial [Zoogloea sp.]|nr:DMT family transporter [Zoogloea sp.]
YLALVHTSATNAALLNSFIPVAIIGLSWFLGRRLGVREGLGVAISLAGVMTIVSRGDPPALLDLTLNVGDLWMLAAVLSWALYTLCLQWRPGGLHPMALLAVLTAIGLLVLLPFWVAELSAGARLAPTPGVLAGVAYTGVFPAFLGYVFWNRAVGLVGGSKAGLFIHLMPVFSTLLAALFLGELPRTFHFAGIALILSGIWLTTARRRG